jgi:hypothetical protein
MHKKQKVFSTQVFQNDTLYEVQVRNTPQRFFESQKPDRIYYWYNSGKILKNQGGYVQNPLHGSCTMKNTEKKLVAQGSYKSGLRSGEWKFWDSYGNLTFTQEYKKGKKHGTAVYYTLGVIVESKQFKHDMLHGKSIVYTKPPQKIVHTYKKGLCVKTDTLGVPKSKVKPIKDANTSSPTKSKWFAKKDKARYDLMNKENQDKLTVMGRCKKSCKTVWERIQKPFVKKQSDTK